MFTQAQWNFTAALGVFTGQHLAKKPLPFEYRPLEGEIFFLFDEMRTIARLRVADKALTTKKKRNGSLLSY